MPKITDDLEATLLRAKSLAGSLKHKYAVLEHLLLALIDDKDASKALLACAANLPNLKATVEDYLENELGEIRLEEPGEAVLTAGFQRVVQRAILHVHASDREEVTGANVLIALCSERESYAVYFLKEQNVSRLDVVSYLHLEAEKQLYLPVIRNALSRKVSQGGAVGLLTPAFIDALSRNEELRSKLNAVVNEYAGQFDFTKFDITN